MSVLINDDGRGFHPSAPTVGFGLMGMRERSDLLGGRLSVDSTPAGGTTVTASFPLARHHRESDLPESPVASEG